MEPVCEKYSNGGEKPYEMNNFYMYMPGGYYRRYNRFEYKIRVMAAIDELLAGEFAELDVISIMQGIGSIHAMIRKVISEGSYLDKQEFLGEKIVVLNCEIEKLRPMFNRLVKMGFDPVLLGR